MSQDGMQNAEIAESGVETDQTLEQLAGAAPAVSPPASADPGDPGDADPGDADPGDADPGDADQGDAQTPDRCEGCEQPATTHDLDGVALCEECAAALLAEAAAPVDPLAAARARGARDRWDQEDLRSLPLDGLSVEEIDAEIQAIGDWEHRRNEARRTLDALRASARAEIERLNRAVGEKERDLMIIAQSELWARRRAIDLARVRERLAPTAA